MRGRGTPSLGYGTDQYVLEYEAELGKPWANLKTWRAGVLSLPHAHRIVTPTLFLCGQEDWNVPVLNSEQMYQALKSLGRETQLIIYPGESHEIRRPSFVTGPDGAGISPGTASTSAARRSGERRRPRRTADADRRAAVVAALGPCCLMALRPTGDPGAEVEPAQHTRRSRWKWRATTGATS